MLVVAGGLLAAPPETVAQSADGRWFISVDGGLQTTTLASIVADPTTFEHFSEEGELTRGVAIDRLPTVAIAGGVRVWRNAGVRLGFFRFARNHDSELSVSIPHPFFFDDHRVVSTRSLKNTQLERSLDVHGYWSLPFGDRLNVQLFGGPSLYFRDLEVAGVQIGAEVYPYDASPGTRVVKFERHPTVLGWTGGADVSFFFSRHLGFGSTARFSLASTEIELPVVGIVTEILERSERSVSSRFNFGGGQISAGFRVRF